MIRYYSIFLFIYLTFVLTFVSVYSQPPVFLVHPVSIATIDGSTVEFTCTANNTILLIYFVNGTDASESSVMNKGFTQSDTEPLSDGGRRRNLTAIASSTVNNNTEIMCTAFGSPNTDSNVSILTIQGPLSSVVDLSRSFIDSSTINISWSPPFTLPGTDISGYNISVTSNSITTNYFTMDSYYVLNEMDSSVCVLVNVSGYNGLDGKSTSTLATQLTVHNVSVEIDHDLNLSLFFIISEDCSGFHVSFTISLFIRDSEEEAFIDSTTITPSGVLVNPTDVFTVSEDQYYTIDVSFRFLADEVNSLSGFSTFGVESVNITSTPSSSGGTVTITCVFRSFSTDDSCTVQLVQSNVPSGEEYTETFNRTDDNIAEGIITGVSTGVYDVLAFDESNPTVVAAFLSGVSIIGEPPEDTTTPPTDDNSATTINNTTTYIVEPTNPVTSTGSSRTCTFCDCSCGCTLCIVIIVVGAVFAVIVVSVVCICCCLWKKPCHKKRINLISDDTSDNLSDKRSPLSSLRSKVEDESDAIGYIKPAKPAESGTASIVYAELSEIRGSKSSSAKHKTTAGARPVVNDDTRVVYSDLLIKGQPPPPPYEPVELQSSVTVIPSAGKDPEIVEFFFNHKDSDDENDTGGKGKYPPRPDERAPSPPDERAPSPPEEDQLPPPVPRKPQSLQPTYGQDSEEGFTDESLHPELAEFRNNSDDAHQGHFMNTPTATYL